jgi:hypothetical protein
MNAPHWYEEDRYCGVISGTWWVASGDRFDPESTIPAPAGSFVRRVAKTPHFDGVKKDGKEPAVIAICGRGPIIFHNSEPNTPAWRKLQTNSAAARSRAYRRGGRFTTEGFTRASSRVFFRVSPPRLVQLPEDTTVIRLAQKDARRPRGRGQALSPSWTPPSRGDDPVRQSELPPIQGRSLGSR